MKEKHKQTGRFAFIVCTGIFLNLLGRFVSDVWKLPFWLDTVGTCIAAYYTNVYGAAVTAVLANVIAGFSNPVRFVYVPVGVLLALLVRFFVKKGYFSELTPAMMSSFGLGVAAVVAATPLDLLFHQGRTGNLWGDALYDMLHSQGFPPLLCTVADESILNIIDKQLCILIAFLILRFFNKRKEKRKRSVSLTAIFLLLSIFFASTPLSVKAQQPYLQFQDYVKTIYDNTSGLPSSEANAIAETEDGYIWIGGYAGLSRYDGTRFEYITEGGLSNVTAMITDEKGRLWIGTNDRGIAVYDKGEFSFLTKEDGLPANSIRTLAATGEGIVYAGTTGKLARIDEDYSISIPEESLNCVTSLAVNEAGLVLGVDNSGELFVMEEDQVVCRQTGAGDRLVYYTVYAGQDTFYIGTTSGLLLLAEYDGGQLYIRERISAKTVSSITQICQDQNGVIWLCGDSGLGYLDEDGLVYALNYAGFNSSLEGMIQDYEGNYWFASSRFGVMKLCKNSFTNVYENAGLEGRVVNAVTKYQGMLYCGTDQGLDVIDPVTWESVENELTECVGEERVRCLQVDSLNRLWVCCYGEPGLLCYDENGALMTYSEQKDQTAGNRFRCLLELEDGTMVAGSSEGVTFIRENRVTGTLTEEDGLPTTQILCLTAGEDGTVYAGSDGSGIYVIREGMLERILTEEDGLSSLIILRMAPFRDGWFVVTSNSLGYMKEDTIRRIEQFPYFNNYDIRIYGEMAWILSSRGIFAAEVENLLGEEELKYRLYDTRNGLLDSITANAWTYIDENACLYFCTNKGVEKFNLLSEHPYSGEYKLQVGSFTADGEKVAAVDGVYEVGPEVERISIVPSICNYMLNDLQVCVYVEGLDSNPSIVRQSSLDTLTYTNVPHGTYTLHLQIYNEEEDQLLQESCYTIVKQARMWETGYFRIYLTVVMLWTISFASWVIYSLRHLMRHRQELEDMRVELEKQVNEQTEQIREQSRKMVSMQWGVIESMAALIESRDGNTGKHIWNTRVYAKLLAEGMLKRGMYPEQITEHFVQTLAEVAPLHDVGKIKISDLILNKPGRLTEDEYEIMKTHTILGGAIIGDILGEDVDPYLLQMARDVAVYHHEKWDGSGYPYGKREKEIPLPARIMAVADVFDSLVSKRVYKAAMTIEEGFEHIERYMGSHFEPEIAKVFLELKPQVAAYVVESEADERG